MATSTPQNIGGSDPSIQRQIQRETDQTLSTRAVSLAPVVSGDQTIFPQSVATTSANSVTITSSVNNDSGDITTVYSSATSISVNPVNQTINQYTSTDSGVGQIIAGTNISISSTGGNGRGEVTINATMPTVGNIASLNLNGNALNVLRGDGTWAADANSNYGDSNVTALLGAFGSNTIVTTGIITADGANLSNVPYANLTGSPSLGNISSVNLDGSSSNILYGNGVFAAPAVSLPIANGTSNINIATANGPITLSSAGNTWTIGTDGSLTAPNSSNIYPAGNNFNVFTPPAGSVQFYSDNGNYSWSLDGFGVMNLPLDASASNTASMYASGNLRFNAAANSFVFTDTGAFVFPTLTVDLHNGGNQTAQTLQFGDDTQQAIITGPTPAANVNAQRLIIQGQRGNGTGEGGDVYFWAGDSDTNGGDIKIYAGDADSATGTGGYINIDAGNGPDSGGQLSLSGGYSSNGQGGQISITPGASANANGAPLNLNGGIGSSDGGNIVITAGYGQANGGQVNITGGISALGLANYGNVVINSGASTWTFDNAGNLVLAGGNSVIQSIANSSLDPTLPNVSTMTLTPDANYNSQVLVLDPTAPGHIHLRAHAFSNIDDPAANIFLGGENTAFEITSGSNNQALIHSNSHTWTFGNDSVLTIPGNLVASGASPAPTLSGFSSLTAADSITVGNANIYSNGHFAANTASFSGNVSGDVALFNDLNLNNLGTNAFLYTNSNRDVYDTQFGYDSANDTMSGGNISLTGTISATNIGNISGVNLDGNVSNVLTGNGTFVALPVINANTVVWSTAPVANTSAGTAGQAAYDSGGNLYVCVATNTWAKFTGATSW